jgi:hypothetical protein
MRLAADSTAEGVVAVGDQGAEDGVPAGEMLQQRGPEVGPVVEGAVVSAARRAVPTVMGFSGCR